MAKIFIKLSKRLKRTENNVVGKNADPYCMCYTRSMSGLSILSYHFGLQEALYMVHCRTKSKRHTHKSYILVLFYQDGWP